MTPDCLSSLALDRLLARELEGDALRRAEAHLAGCAECRVRHEDAAAFKARLGAELGTLAELGIGPAPARTATRTTSRAGTRTAFAGVLAVAAALLLFLHQR